jgi:tRNA A37 methylthiotransferase MiaB
MTFAKHESLVGREFEVLLDAPAGNKAGWLQGYSREYHLVRLAANESRMGRIVRAKAVSGHPWGVTAELVVTE